MFTKPVNIPVPLTEIKQKPKKKCFNGYVLCFLFLILCILLVLAYRIEVKIIQQNLRKNYDDYITEMKKSLIEEENLLILGKNHYDVKQNGDDYEVINVQIMDGDPTVDKTPKIPISSEKPDSTASIKDEIGTTVDLGEDTENNASEISSAEDNTTSEANTSEEDFSSSSGTSEEATSTLKTTPKLVENGTNPTEATNQSQSQSTGSSSTSGKSDSSSSATTKKAVTVADYVTKSNKINATVGNKTEEYYDPKKAQIVVIQVQQDTDYPEIDTAPTTDKNKKYYHLPKDMFEANKAGNTGNPKKTTKYQDEAAYEDSDYSIERENLKTTKESNGNQNEDFDPPNENFGNFPSNIENINKIISNIHKEVSKQIDKDIADMQKDLPPLNVDLDFEVDPYYDRSKVVNKKSPPKNAENGDDPYLLIDM